jgi:hypothetical protein
MFHFTKNQDADAEFHGATRKIKMLTHNFTKNQGAVALFRKKTRVRCKTSPKIKMQKHYFRKKQQETEAAALFHQKSRGRYVI